MWRHEINKRKHRARAGELEESDTQPHIYIYIIMALAIPVLLAARLNTIVLVCMGYLLSWPLSEAVLAAEAPKVGDGDVELRGGVRQPHVEQATDVRPLRRRRRRRSTLQQLTPLPAGHGGVRAAVGISRCANSSSTV